VCATKDCGGDVARERLIVDDQHRDSRQERDIAGTG
jgi:hypothetical protein